VPKNAMIEQVIAAIPDDTAPVIQDQLSHFIACYFQQLSETDMLRFGSEDLFGAALCHWELAQTRIPGEATLKLYNPQIQEDRWQTSHTVIEIVTDDMPHLVMSLSMTLAELGLNVYQTIHPVIDVTRSADGALLTCQAASDDSVASSSAARPEPDTQRESLMHIEIDRITDPDDLADLRKSLQNTLLTVASIQRDHAAMMETLQSVQSGLKELDTDNSTYAESLALMSWIDQRNFSPLGAIEYKVLDNLELQATETSMLGLYSLDDETQRPPVEQILPPDHTILFAEDQLVSISKSSLRSPIVRPENLDVVVVRHAGGADTPASIDCLIGLFSPFVKNLDTSQVPVLRKKTQAVQASYGHPADSHAGKTMANTT